MGKIAKNIDELKKMLKNYKDKKQTIAMINGCFDLFHIGHLDLIRTAKSKCDILIVCVNSDKSIKINKGLKRPIIPENERIEILSSLIYIDHVILFDEDAPRELLRAIEPDIIVKENEYKYKKIIEIEDVEGYDSKIFFMKKNFNVSTSSIIKKIKEVETGE